MDKKIIFKDVSVMSKGNEKYNRNVLKNLNLNIGGNNVLSIVGEDSYGRHLFGKLLSQEIEPTTGKAEYIGKYFLNKSDYRGKKIDFIKFEDVEEVKDDITIDEFLRSDFLDKKEVKRNYGLALEEANSELEKLIETKNVLSDEKLLRKRYSEERIKEIRDKSFAISTKIEEDSTLTSAVDQYNETIKDNNKIIKNEWKNIDDEIVILKKLHIGKEKVIKEANKELLLELKKIKKLEKVELRDIKSRDELPRDIETLIYTRSLRELSKLSKYISNLKLENISFDNSLIRSFDRTKNLTDQRSYYNSLENILKEVTTASKYVNSEISIQLRDRVNFIRNILDPLAPINSKQFNILLNFVHERYREKIQYYTKVIEDIQYQIDSNDLKDKQEKTNSLRQVWEYEKISLRFQEQIYRERIIVINNYLDSIETASLSHTLENNNNIYNIIIELENLLTKIDVASNRWRFKRKANLIRLKSSIKIKLLKETNEELKDRTKECKEKIQLKSKLEPYRESYVQEFVNTWRDRGFQGEHIPEQRLEEYGEELIEVEKRIEKVQERISTLREHLDVNDIESTELKLTYLIDDINFSTDLLDLKLSTTSIAQRQRLSLIKSVLSGKELIVIENPKYDLDINAKSEIAASIKEISTKYNVMIILLTDDVKLASTASDRIALFNNGTIFEKGSIKEVLNNPIHPYTKYMIKTIDNKVILNKYRGEKLNHSSFTPLENISYTEDHVVFCSREELDRWVQK